MNGITPLSVSSNEHYKDIDDNYVHIHATSKFQCNLIKGSKLDKIETELIHQSL